MSSEPRERNAVKYDTDWAVCAYTKDGQQRFLSSRYGCSIHNCSCNKSKTGIILYPHDTRYKNIVLLMCGDCYHFKGKQTQHQELFDWYHAQYGKSKSFELVSGFAQDENGNLKYNSGTFNDDKKYGTGVRNMEDFEQKILKHVVKYKFNNYQVGKMPCNSTTTFQCPQGHSLQLCDDDRRSRDGGRKYPDEGFICDICEQTFPDGLSWHCPCSSTGCDKCGACVAFDPKNSKMIMTNDD